MTPVSTCVQVPEVGPRRCEQAFALRSNDRAQSTIRGKAGSLPESAAIVCSCGGATLCAAGFSHRRLVVEEDSITRVHPVRLAIVDHDPVAVLLRDAIGGPRVEWRQLRLWHLPHPPKELTCRRLIESGGVLQTRRADAVQQPQDAEPVDVSGVLGRFERSLHVALRCQIVDFIWPDLLDDLKARCAIRKVAIMQEEPGLWKLIDAVPIERRGASHDPVDRIPLREEQLSEIRAVLPCDAGH
eukprot:7380968-Prymnesium_polylepis.2